MEVERINVEDILTSITDGIICIGVNNRVLAFTGGASKIFGYNSEEMIGEKIDNLLVNIQKVRSETDFPVNGIIGRTKNGSNLAIEVINYVKNSKGYEICIVRDQTRANIIEKFLDSYHDNIQYELNKMVQRKSMALEKLTFALISALEDANLFNDTETGNHILRVSAYSGILAEKLGCSKQFVKKIKMYSSLHDVGKVGIPDALLKKPGKYTKQEIIQMQEHVLIGARMLDHPEIDEMARNITMYHHEKWDGTGYIKKLKGDDIPLEARIVSIVDNYDALSTNRVYKTAYSENKTISIIKKGSGKDFDPELVKIFLENTAAFKQIKQTYK